jgi:NADP-dependent 3-hydroxy acid dehydrogenase YdfG
VTIIAPGFVETELLSHNPDYVQEAAQGEKETVGDVLEASDIADAIVFAVYSRRTSSSTRCSCARPSRRGS